MNLITIKPLWISVVIMILLNHTTSFIAQSQSLERQNLLSIKNQYHQIKESANYGFVNHGINISIEYSYNKISDFTIFNYESQIAFGVNYRNGIGLNWHIKPVKISYGFKTSQEDDRAVFVGLYGSVNNLLQLYPELQSGHIFWITTIEFGPEFYGRYILGKRELTVVVSSSIYGLTSRPKATTEKYFYTLNFGDIMNESFSNMRFGSNNLFNHSLIKIEYRRSPKRNFSTGYTFEYLGYYKDPRYEYLTHSIVLKWTLGK